MRENIASMPSGIDNMKREKDQLSDKRNASTSASPTHRNSPGAVRGGEMKAILSAATLNNHEMKGHTDTRCTWKSNSDGSVHSALLIRRTRTVMVAIATVVAVLQTPLCAQGPGKRVMTPQDLWAMKRLNSPELSPDGRTAAIVVQEWSIDKNKSTSNIWLVPVAGGEPRRLTAAQAADGSPVWSPDGTRIAFVSKRGEDQVAALYVIRTDGGEAEKVLELPFALSNPRWMPDGQRLVMATTCIPRLVGSWTKENIAAMEKELKSRKEPKMTAKVTEDRVYRFFDHWLTDTLANRLLVVHRHQGIQGSYPEVGPLVPSQRHGGLRPVAGRLAGSSVPQHHTTAVSRQP